MILLYLVVHIRSSLINIMSDKPCPQDKSVSHLSYTLAYILKSFVKRTLLSKESYRTFYYTMSIDN